MYTIPELDAHLKQAGADYALIEQAAPIRSASDAAPYYDITKAAPTFVLQSDRGLIACILSGNRGRLDFEDLKARFGFSRLKMADRKKVPAQTGYTVGSIPLIGLELDCIFDDSLLAFDYIYGGTGDELVTLKIRPADVKRLNRVFGVL